MTASSTAELAREARLTLAFAMGLGWLAQPATLLAGANFAVADLLLAGALGLVQLVLFLRARDARAALACLALTTLQGFLPASRVADASAVGIALIALASSLFALIAQARRRTHASLPARLPLSGGRSASSGVLTRGARALGLAVVVLVVAPLLSILAGALAELLPGPRAPEAAAEVSDGARSPEASPGPREDSAPSSLNGRFPERLEWATSAPLEDDTPLVVLRPLERETGSTPELLHVRGLVLERFTATGMRAEHEAALVELDLARTTEGWNTLFESPAEANVHGYEIEQVPLRLGDQDLSLLFTPTPLLALDCPGARVRPGAEAYALLPAQGLLRFRARGLERRFELCAVLERAERDVPPSTLALPPPSPELAAIRSLAAEVTRGAANDRERVARVLAYFRTGFEYEPEPTGIPGLSGLARFLERRAGGCTHYAATSALMLRTLGLPTRVATGFLARRTEAEPDVLVATPRSGHAWFEVCFADLGWVTCDPTPAGSPGLEGLASGPVARSWWSSGVEILGSFLGGESIPVGRLGEFFGGTRSRGTLVLGACALLWISLRLRSRRTQTAALVPHAKRARPDPALERLLEALARAGAPRPSSHTLREHARTLVARRGPGVASLEALVERLYHTRFGNASWSSSDEALLGHVIEAVAAIGARDAAGYP